MGARGNKEPIWLELARFADAINVIRADLGELYDAQNDEWHGSAEGRAVFEALTRLEGAANDLRAV